VYEVTINRDEMERFMAAHADALLDESGEQPTTDDGNPFGQPESELTTAVDVSAFIDAKRGSLTCHASQVTDSGLFLRMPPEIFLEVFGTEWFTRVGAPKGIHETELAGLT
jgi:LmbE family N-acetylglucosaminyl deacetylase